MNIEKSFIYFSKILDFKSLQNLNFSEYVSNNINKCHSDLLYFKNESLMHKKNIYQENNEKLNNELKIKEQKKSLDLIKFTKNHFMNYSNLLSQIQQKFFSNKYLLLPVLEELIEFTKYIKAHFLLLKRNHQSEKKEKLNLISDFFNNEMFINLNKNLNLFEPENIMFIQNSLKKQSNNKNYAENFLQLKESKYYSKLLSSKKCIIIKSESDSNYYFEDVLKKNIKDVGKKTIYCSKYLTLLKYFALKFNLEYYNDIWRLESLNKVIDMIKFIKSDFEHKIDLINQQFNAITLKFSSSKNYIAEQIKFFQSIEYEILKEISVLEENSIISNSGKDYEIENELLEDVISYKTQIMKNEGKLIFEFKYELK